MLIKRSSDIRSSEITPATVWHSRRRLLQNAGVAGAAALLPGVAFGDSGESATAAEPRQVLRHMGKPSHRSSPAVWHQEKVHAAVPGGWYAEDEVTPYDYVTQYNNFYEFGTGKADPYSKAQEFETCLLYTSPSPRDS